ncbi:MAG: YifB family Mg chelatase-like AAA ATPase [Lachnospiraceae bacterium]|nr:YifB family Mg chelatase-like AAA ATPase [Lachnospiraceae bacterium]
MYSNVCTGALQGIYAYLVQTEVDAAGGLPGLEMVGCPAGEVREARERVKVALKNAGVDLPPLKITVNLSPADVRKDGTGFDLPIAVGILCALERLPQRVTENTLFLGELGLDGEIRPVKGVLPIVREAAARGIKRCIVPAANAKEGGVVQGIEVIGAENLPLLLEYLQANKERQKELIPPTIVSPEELLGDANISKEYDFANIVGQEFVKRGAQVAAAGFHNMLIVGPPGTGKTMVGKSIAGILPPMTLKESLEVSGIYSVRGMLDENQTLITERPVIQPHHTVSAQALAGGGRIPKPGLVSLAHRGVLFLDEFPEFPRTILDILRQPLEEKQVVVSRAYGSYRFPADFMLVAAMNPCPCGHYPDLNKCTCTESEVHRYLGHVSGPILDRIDICVEAPEVNIHALSSSGRGISSEEMRERVKLARSLQERRFQGTAYHFNSQILAGDMQKYCAIGLQEEQMLEKLLSRGGFSVRAYHRILKVARTVADLDGSEKIEQKHLSEAVCYRLADEKYWKRGKGA